MSLSRFVLSCGLVVALSGCSLLFSLFSHRAECDPEAFTNRCEGDVSVLCTAGKIVRIDCARGNTFCNEETTECESICGNGFIESGEDCDPGPQPDGEQDKNCNLACQKIDGCGDGIRSATEDCDDGNNTSGDGCDASCRFETFPESDFDQEVSQAHGATLKPSITTDIIIRGQLLRQRPLNATTPADDVDVFTIENTSSQLVTVRADILDPRRGNQSCGSSAEFPNLSMRLGAANADNVPLGSNARRSNTDDCPGLSVTIPPGDFIKLAVSLEDNLFGGFLQSEYLLVINFDEEPICGDGVVQTTEQCELKSAALCDGDCQLVPTCGNSVIENLVDGIGAGEILYEESCDDGNNTSGDGCDATCHREDVLDEQEPNGGSTISPGFDEIAGNDFTTQGAQLITSSALLSGQLEPAGDEDVFALQNTESTARAIRVETHNPDGAPCSAIFNTLLNVRDESGELLLYGGFKSSIPSIIDACSRVDLVLQPQELVYLQLIKYGDNRRTPNYLLQVDFSDCGNGQIEPLTEECDDANNAAGDGCDPSCQREPQCGDGLLDAPERCDDHNLSSNDGCSSSCQIENTNVTASEPNDFIKDADGPFSHDVVISGFLDGTDVYEITNNANEEREILVSVKDPVSGVGALCPANFPTIDLLVLGATSGADPILAPIRGVVCPSASFILGPHQTYFVQLESFFSVTDYLLNVQFAHCGDGVVEGDEECDAPDGTSCDQRCQRLQRCGDSFLDAPEECDDGNNTAGDGCDQCKLEGFTSLTEQGDPATTQLLTLQENTLQRALLRVPVPLIGNIDQDSFDVENTSAQFVFAQVSVQDPRSGSRSRCITITPPTGSLLGIGEDGCRTVSIPLQPGEIQSVQFDPGIKPPTLEGAFYTAKVELSVCGDGRVSFGEECEPANSATCDAQCQRVASCGDGFVDLPEQCDDGNTANGDSCPSDCAAINFAVESEPNDDGSPNVNAFLNGNDFSSANADGPFSQDVLIFASLNQLGDEDVFLVQNPLPGPVRVRADTFNSILGLAPCGTSFDSVLNIRNASGLLLARNDDRDFLDLCAGLDFLLLPGGSAFVQVLDKTDNRINPGYLLQLSFTPIICGDGLIEAPELCDDGNAVGGDGCSLTCQTEDNFVCIGQPSICHPIVCGDGVIEFPESCDDGNTLNGDSCNSTCNPFIIVQESEPNDDGTPSSGGDFALGAAEGPFTTNTLIKANINPVGDDDLFLFTNTSPDLILLRLDTFNSSSGVGVPCPFTFDTELRVLDSNGNLLLQNDQRAFDDSCSGLDVFLPAGESVIAQVVEFFEDSTLGPYLLLASFTPLVCGDGILVLGEQCDDLNNVNNDGCSSSCQREQGFACIGQPSQCHAITCGDGFRDLPEQCDDGNITNGDGCSSVCLNEATPEIEPNDDGATSTGGNDLNGNDFSIVNAQGPFTQDSLISGSLPAGDEDVFEIKNTGNGAAQIQVQTFDPAIGLGLSCGGFPDGALDTVITLRNATGLSLVQNDERSSGVDSCSSVSLSLQPGQSVFAHVMIFGDATGFPGYLLEINFL